MKLSDIENPLVADSSKSIWVKTSMGAAKVVGYTPEMFIGGGFYDKVPAHWHVLINGDTPGYERQVLDGEIIEGC